MLRKLKILLNKNYALVESPMMKALILLQPFVDFVTWSEFCQVHGFLPCEWTSISYSSCPSLSLVSILIWMAYNCWFSFRLSSRLVWLSKFWIIFSCGLCLYLCLCESLCVRGSVYGCGLLAIILPRENYLSTWYRQIQSFLLDFHRIYQHFCLLFWVCTKSDTFTSIGHRN